MGLLILQDSGGGGSAPPAALDYADLQARYSADGFVYHGGADRSKFYEEVGQVTECADSGVSPVGFIQDITLLGNDAEQASDEYRPVFYVDGNGIRSFRYGLVGGGSRFMLPAATVTTNSAMTQIAVYKPTAEVSGNNAALMSTFIGGSWGGGGYHWLASVDGSPAVNFLCDSGVSGVVATAATGAPTIVVARRTGLGANEATVTTYNMAGEQIATATGTQNAKPKNSLCIGYSGINSSGVQCAFLLHLRAALDAEDITAIIADIVASLGDWTA